MAWAESPTSRTRSPTDQGWQRMVTIEVTGWSRKFCRSSGRRGSVAVTRGHSAAMTNPPSLLSGCSTMSSQRRRTAAGEGTAPFFLPPLFLFFFYPPFFKKSYFKTILLTLRCLGNCFFKWVFFFKSYFNISLKQQL